MCWGRVSGLGDPHFEFLENILGNQETIPGEGGSGIARGARKLSQGDLEGERSSPKSPGDEESLGIRAKNNQNVQGTVSALGEQQERSGTALGLGEQPQGQGMARGSKKQATVWGRVRGALSGGGQGPGTHCALLTASSIGLGEAPALSATQAVPGSHETAGVDLQVSVPQVSWGGAGGGRQKTAADWLGRGGGAGRRLIGLPGAQTPAGQSPGFSGRLKSGRSPFLLGPAPRSLAPSRRPAASEGRAGVARGEGRGLTGDEKLLAAVLGPVEVSADALQGGGVDEPDVRGIPQGVEPFEHLSDEGKSLFY